MEEFTTGFSGCAVQRTVEKLKPVDVGLLAGGLSRQPRGGVALLTCWEEDVGVPVFANR